MKQDNLYKLNNENEILKKRLKKVRKDRKRWVHKYLSLKTGLNKKENIINNKDTVTFNIKVTMKKRWVPYFCTFLKRMQYNGNIGHSELLGFYSDGDGDFRPEFNIQGIKYNKVSSIKTNDNKSIEYYDAK